MDETTWKLRVRAESNGPNTVFVRKSQFQAGDPLHFDPEYPHVTAVEYLLGAVGADLVGGLRVVARRQTLRLDNVEAVVSGQLDNPLTYLGVVGEKGHPGLSRVSATVYASSPEPEERLQDAWRIALERSPLIHTLTPTVKLDFTLKVTI